LTLKQRKDGSLVPAELGWGWS